MVSQSYEYLLVTYQWNLLWQKVKDHQGNSACIAIKSFLLAVMWSEKELSSSLLMLIKNNENQTNCFYIALTYLYLDNEDKFIEYTNRINDKKLKWMRNWLIIEYYGRYKRYTEQLDIIEAACIGYTIPPIYIVTSIISSLSFPTAEYGHVLKWFLQYGDFANIDQVDYLNDCNYNMLIIELQYLLKLRSGVDKQLIEVCTDTTICKRRRAFEYYKSLELYNALELYSDVCNGDGLNIREILLFLTLEASVPTANFQRKIYDKVDYCLSNVPDSLSIKGSIVTFSLVYYWIDCKLIDANKVFQQYYSFNTLPDTTLTKPLRIFFNYILSLCQFWQNNQIIYTSNEYKKDLYFIGESHSLSACNSYISLRGIKYKCASRIVFGVKMFHLGYENKFYQAKCIAEHLYSLPQGSDIVLCIGEIDSRYDEGIWKTANQKNLDLNDVISKTVTGYVEMLQRVFARCCFGTIVIQGIPAPNNLSDDFDNKEDCSRYLSMVRDLNILLKKYCLEQGWMFLDVYSATVSANLRSNKIWHLDTVHLKPSFYLEADNWLISPSSEDT